MLPLSVNEEQSVGNFIYLPTVFEYKCFSRLLEGNFAVPRQEPNFSRLVDILHLVDTTSMIPVIEILLRREVGSICDNCHHLSKPTALAHAQLKRII